MNKIRVIDLLNKIANGEELKFKLKNDDLTYSIKKGNYLRIEELNRDAEWYIDKSWLNEEVEILDEEDKDIPLIPDDELWYISGNKGIIEDAYTYSKISRDNAINHNFKVLKEKINQILEVMNNEYNK